MIISDPSLFTWSGRSLGTGENHAERRRGLDGAPKESPTYGGHWLSFSLSAQALGVQQLFYKNEGT